MVNLLIIFLLLVGYNCNICAASTNDTTGISGFCSPSLTLPLIRKGEPTYVCINVNDEFRSVHTPLADEFTVIRITNSWNDTRIGQNPKGSYLTVSSITGRTPYKLYTSANGHIYPFLTAIISVKQGLVQGISWDDGCTFCGPTLDTCEPNLYGGPYHETQILDEGFTCFNRLNTCSMNNITTTVMNGTSSLSVACDLTIYIGWTGTDRAGKYLSSAGLRFSQFQKYSLTSYFESVKSKATGLLESAKTITFDREF